MISTVRSRWNRLKRRAHLRPSDVILASYPKSGNTWVRFIWANLVSLTELDGLEVDFHVLNRLLGPEYDRDTWGTVVPKRLFRLVKTHLEYDPQTFRGNRVLYVWRHPGDVAVSYFHFLEARRDGPELGSFSDFLRDPELGVTAWCRHVAGWLPRSDSVARYEDLKSDTFGTLRRVLDELGNELGNELGTGPVDDRILAEAIARSSFERVRELEDDHGRPASSDFREGFRFTRKGEVGEWRENFSDQDVDFLRRELKRYGLEQRFGEAYG